jgi:hypothetical protein
MTTRIRVKAPSGKIVYDELGRVITDDPRGFEVNKTVHIRRRLKIGDLEIVSNSTPKKKEGK